jgi:hypothetical protein
MVPIAYHTLCTDTGFNILHDYELITWILGPLLYKKRCGGKFILQADEGGFSLVDRLGLASLYDDHKVARIPKGIDPKVFWCAGRYVTMPYAPCVSIDFDAVILRPFWENYEDCSVVCMNPEPIDWNPYRDGQNRYAEHLRKAGYDFDWSIPSVNCGIMAILDESFRQLYVETVLEVMKIISDLELPKMIYNDLSKSEYGVYIAEAVLVDQRILSMLAKKEGKKLQCIAGFSSSLDSHSASMDAIHLWKMKHGFIECSEFRQSYMNWALSMLYNEFPKHWSLTKLVDLPTFVYQNVHTTKFRFSKTEKRYAGEIQCV